ncbi:site-specific DNA-methyltransferase [Burkholderia sp. AU31652]|uniref:site-specific DNA-methyltransferase n=1 Tax=Burkholderia sp. AU31652 TaxID=2015354 RepID=UPI000B7AAA2B|nr:site-specific DNA-methyltransferase [Burkholderia sp. AU31652]OXI87433.1 site-specific DNA-methyltransferase [Burkholderia sp. AU31652]
MTNSQPKSFVTSDEVFEVSGATPNFRTELAAQLAELVPEAIADGKVDVEKLKELLDGDAAEEGERFGLFWPGKRRALRAAQEPTTATLKPDFMNSKNWNTTQNVFIEGDNLEVLKILQKHYHNKIKLIYIDPPYNTGKDFVYPDNYAEGLKTYLEWTNQVNEEGKKLSSNSETEGRYHSNWLSMMYPRLKLARNLLTDDGVILISIDDHEQDNLKKLCNEVFGEGNFIASMIWEKGRKNDAKLLSVGHEYILVYAKSAARLKELGVRWREEKPGAREIWEQYLRLRTLHGQNNRAIEADLQAWYAGLPKSHPSKKWSRYKRVDVHGPWRDRDISWPGGSGPRYDVLHEITKKPCKVPERGWIYATPEEMQRQIKLGLVEFRKDHTEPPFRKAHIRPIPGEVDGVNASDESNSDDAETGSEEEFANQVRGSYFYKQSQVSVKALRTLMGAKVFDNPKDYEEIGRLINYVTVGDVNAIILDFFAGSSSTAHAVMALNGEDDGKRRFIQVQLPEPTPESSEARKAGFKTIAEISRKRIELAGEKIKSDLANNAVDTGFRAYKLSDTNFAKWRVSSDIAASVLEQHLLDLRDSAADGASADDLLIEILLKLGFSLTAVITPLEIAGLNVRRIGDNQLLAYLDERTKPTLEQLRALVATAPKRLIMLEDAFRGDDELKTNLAQLCKSKGIEMWTA